MSASVDLGNVAADVRTSVKEACRKIAVDLGAPDEFPGSGDDAITNDKGSGACDVAALRVKTIMDAHANANFALEFVHGECHQDFEQIKKCDQQCKQVDTCDPGTVEERCTPAELSVECQGKCKAQAFCKGTVDVAANCIGKCESECQGECKGTCTAQDGKKTENDPNCRGKCSATCNGTCRGECQVEATEGIDCGANVRCKGGCEATYVAPACETHCTPPKCTVSTSCWDSCTSSVEAKTVCEPSRVELLADVTVHADVQKLVTTINANLSALIDVAEVKGQVAVSAGERLVTAGKAVVASTDVVDLESQSCAAAAAERSVSAALTLRGSVTGSAAVVTACTSRSQ